MRIVIVGGSAAGLTAALLLARSGHQVEVIDPDDLRPAADLETAAEAAFRHTAPQLVHLHQVMPLAWRLLRDELPDVLAELLRVGAVESPLTDRLPPTMTDRSPRPGDEELTALQARRSTLDWVLRRAAVDQPRVRLSGRASATGLVLRRGDPPRVVGVRTESGERAADVVVDASGRRSKVDDWLAAAGARRPERVVAPCEIAYHSRHYRLRADVARPAPGRISVIAPLPFVTFGAVTADNDVLSTVVCPLVDDDALRALRHLTAYDAVLRTLPGMGPWLAAAEPITQVHTMGGFHNAFRRLVVGGRPVARGLHVIGDACCTTNPTLGRGISTALRGATDLAASLRAHPDDLDAQTRAMAAASEQHLFPWFAEQMRSDAARVADVRRALAGDPPAESRVLSNPERLRVAAMVEPSLFRTLMSLHGMLRTPQEVHGDPWVRARVGTVLGSAAVPATNGGPSRQRVRDAIAESYAAPVA